MKERKTSPIILPHGLYGRPASSTVSLRKALTTSHTKLFLKNRAIAAAPRLYTEEPWTEPQISREGGWLSYILLQSDQTVSEDPADILMDRCRMEFLGREVTRMELLLGGE